MDDFLYRHNLGTVELKSQAMENGPNGWTGTDRFGRPVYVELGGRFNTGRTDSRR